MSWKKSLIDIQMGNLRSRTLLVKVPLLLVIVACLLCLYKVNVMKDSSSIDLLEAATEARCKMTAVQKERSTDGIAGSPFDLSTLIGAARYYSANNTIVIASFDVTYTPMALNLYVTSLRRFNITNYLFVCSDGYGCAELERFGIHCVQFANMSKANETSVFRSPEFRLRVRMKSRIVLRCLENGLNVIYVDLDIVFLKDPLPAFDGCPDCDLIAQRDRDEDINSGFYLARNTTAALNLFERLVRILSSRRGGEQSLVNKLLRAMEGQYKLRLLDPERFPHGRHFFQQGQRMFAGDAPCSACVIVHNNFIYTLEAKIYRFKEYGLWAVDTAGYYSDADRNYIRYSNPEDFGAGETNEMEIQALKTALVIGHVLNRTVILPRFHCYGVDKYTPLPNQWCHFCALFSVRRFEARLASPDVYRENVFLDHPLVPESTKTSTSRLYVIKSTLMERLTNSSRDSPSGALVKTPKGSAVTDTEIREWFSSEPSRVLTFHSLYNEFVINDLETKEFAEVLDSAIFRTNFMQSQF